MCCACKAHFPLASMRTVVEAGVSLTLIVTESPPLRVGHQ